MRKLQSFYILKLSSKRLKQQNYRIEISLDGARLNNEVVRLGDSQLLQVLRRLRGDIFDREELYNLEREYRKLNKNPDSGNRLSDIGIQIDNILFERDIIALNVDNKTHYNHIVKNGFFVNGIKFVRLLSGAGNLRRNTVIFVRSDIYSELKTILDNGRDVTKRLNPAKFNAYFGLFNSSGYSVSFPNLTVIPDYEYERIENIIWINEDDEISNENKELLLNAFDGQGLISVQLAEKWSRELEMNYIPGSFIFRSPYGKGQLVTFPIQEFIRENGKHMSTDVWGNPVDLRFVDVILSESQLKLWDSYSSADDYIKSCHSNGLGFFITRVSPQTNASNTTTNYMFLNALDISDDEIEALAKDTLEHFWSLLSGDIFKMSIFLGGSIFDKEVDSDIFHRLPPVVKALLINNDLKNDPYILDVFVSSLNKQIEEAYLGKLFVQGNYSVIASDPYAHMEHALGLEPKGLLSDDEYFHRFWINKNIKQVACGRSPLTHPSEIILANIVNKKTFSKWYRYLDTVFVLPHNSMVTVKMADGDFDGDMAFSTSNEVFINGKQDLLTISYGKPKAEKKPIKEKDLHKADLSGFFSKVGWITNISSSLYARRAQFEEGSKERTEIDRRIALCRLFQGAEIDSAKLISNENEKREIPKTWVKWNANKGENSTSSMVDIQFNNSILADKRPAYMRWLYKHYNKEFRKELFIFDGLAIPKFRTKMEYLLLKETPTDEEQKLIDKFKEMSNFIHSDCVMNKMSNHVRRRMSIIRKNSRILAREFDYRILLSNKTIDLQGEENIVNQVISLVTEYGKLKKSAHKGNTDFKNIEQVNKYMRKKAHATISNFVDLVDATIIVCYKINQNLSKSFLWNILGDDIVHNLLLRYGNKIKVPKKDMNGNINFLFERYSVNELYIEE